MLPGEDAHPSPRPTKSDSGKDSERSSDKSILVNKIIEGLRGDAFSIARDLGIDVIMGKGASICLSGGCASTCFQGRVKKPRSFLEQVNDKEEYSRGNKENRC